LADEPNSFFSPLSLNMALGMLYNGSSGNTRTEMAEVLGMAGMTETEINAYYQKMMQALLKVDPRTEIGIANSIWYRNTLPVKKPFIDLNKKHFDAAVQALDFSKPDAADIINKWCADKTKNRIKEIIEKPIPGNIVMYLINALYFKGKWLEKFDKAQTKPDDFTKADNGKKKVNMMEQTAHFPYYADEHLQCVEMYFGNQAFSMVFLLPSEETNIDRLIDYLDNDVWQNVLANMRHSQVWLKAPRFKIECDILLNDPVMNVGMKRIFDFGGGFANISDVDLAVSYIKQKTFVEVNEAGAEAAAVTVIGMRDMAPPEPPKTYRFFANRPFLYLIKEKSTGVILFIGRMDDPKE
jgi:serpin B